MKNTQKTRNRALNCYSCLLFFFSAAIWEVVDDFHILPPQVISYVFHQPRKDRLEGKVGTGPVEAEAFVLLMNGKDTLEQTRLLALLEDVMEQEPAAVGIDISNEHVLALDPVLMDFLWRHQERIVVPSTFVTRLKDQSVPIAGYGLPETMLGNTQFGEQEGVTAYYERSGKNKDQSKSYKSFSAVLCQKALGRPSTARRRGLIDFTRKVGILQDDVSLDVKSKWFSAFRGKMVVIGSDSPSDRKLTPVGKMTGAEIHAYAAATIFRNDTNPFNGKIGLILRRIFALIITLIVVLVFRSINSSRARHTCVSRAYGIIVNLFGLAYGAVIACLVSYIPSLVSFNLAFWSILSIPFFVLIVDDFINNCYF